MACFQIEVNGRLLPKKFESKVEADRYAQSMYTVSDNAIDYYTTRKEGIKVLDMNKLLQYALYDKMYSASYNSLVYGDISIGHKDYIDVVKRNGNLPSDGMSLGFDTAKTAIIQAEQVNIDNNEVDAQDAQTYASPHWYLNKYLKATSKSYDKVIEIYKNKIIPGFELTTDEINIVKKSNADLTERKIVIRSHFDLIKTSFHIQSRQKASKLKKDTPEIRQRIIDLWNKVEQTESLEAKREIISNIHSFYRPIHKYHHDMLNSTELNQLDYITVDSSAKLAQPNVGRYDQQTGVFQIAPYTISDHFVREQMKTDSKPTTSVHSSQLQGLITNEQNRDLVVDGVTVGKIIDNYFDLKADRTIKLGNKKMNQAMLPQGEGNMQFFVDTIMKQSNKAQGDVNLQSMISVTENKPRVSLNNNLIAKDFETAVVTPLNSALKPRVAGKAYTLHSDVGYSVFEDADGNVVPMKDHVEGLKERKLKFDNKENDLYYAEVIVSEDVARKLGLKIGLGVRIPLEGKNSTVIVKIVDTLPSIYSSTIIAPAELLLYSGADFDIDKLYVRHYAQTKDGKAYGSYRNIKNEKERLERAYKEYLEDGNEELINRTAFNEQVNNNYGKHWTDVKPITVQENNNLQLDSEIYLAYNEFTLEHAKYPNSLEVVKQVLIPFLEESGFLNDMFKITSVDSTADKLEIQDSIDVGSTNIGAVANFNILYNLIKSNKVDLSLVSEEIGTEILGKNSNFYADTEIDLGTNKLDASGLTKNGKIRTTAFIAVVLNMMTDNAKEQLADKLKLSLENLNIFLTGVGIGINPKTLLLMFQDIKNEGSNTTDVFLPVNEDLTDEQIEELEKRKQKVNLITNSLTDNDILTVITGDYKQVYGDLITRFEAVEEAKKVLKIAAHSLEKVSLKFIPLTRIRSLVKGLDKNFTSIDVVNIAMDKLEITAKKTNSIVDTNLYDRMFELNGDYYYRPVLGNSFTFKYSFSSRTELGEVVMNQKDLLTLLATTVIYDQNVAADVNLKRNSIIQNIFNGNQLTYNQRNIRTEDKNRLIGAFVTGLSSRAYEHQINKAIEQNDNLSDERKYIRDNIASLNLLYHNVNTESKIAQLKQRLLMPDSKYKDNKFINSIYTVTDKSKLYNKSVTTVNIDTLNEVSSDHKDLVATDFYQLALVKSTKTTKELMALEELTDDQAATLFARHLIYYSYLVNNNAYRRGSITTVLPAKILERFYRQLNPIDDLFRDYSKMNRPDSLNKDLTNYIGKPLENYILEFFEYEGLNNGFVFKGDTIQYFNSEGEKAKLQYKFISDKIQRNVLLKNGTTINYEYTATKSLDILKADIGINSISLFKNLYNIKSEFYAGYKAKVFYPILQHSGNKRLLLTRVIAAEKEKLYEFIYDNKRGKVYKTQVDTDYNPVGETIETDRMALAGIYAEYKVESPYAEKYMSNSISPASYREKVERLMPSAQLVETTTTEQTTNPLIRAGVKPTDMSGNAAKDIQMASESTQFIGFQSGTAAVSSTNKYRLAWGDKANTNNYTSNDIVMVSGSGMFRGVTEEQIRNTLKEKYKPLLNKAIESGASFRVGNQYAKGNLSDKLIADYLADKGYIEEKLDGYSRWSKPTQSTTQQPSVEISSEAKGLAAALTNPTELAISKGNLTQSYPVEYNGKPYDDVEAAYQSLKDRSESKTKPSKQNSNNYKLMVELITAKLEQHPRLVTEITKKGGVSWLSAATHQPTKKNTVWETGGQNWFIEALTDAYINVQPTTQQPSVESEQKAIYNRLGNKTKSENVVISDIRTKDNKYDRNANIKEAKDKGRVYTMEVDSDVKSFSNPWASFNRTGTIKVSSTKESVLNYIDWLTTDKFINVKPERRAFILDTLKSGKLKGRQLQYYAELREPSHATALDYLINKYDWVSETAETTQQPTPPTDSFRLEGGFRFGENPQREENAQLMPVDDFINTMLLRHDNKLTAELHADVEAYNRALGYEAVVVTDIIKPNIEKAVKSKTGLGTATSILEKLSKKFNIPYVFDSTMPYKGKFMNGKVYINPDLMTDDTAFHEFAHPFIAAIKRTNRPLYNRLVSEIRKEKTILAKTDKLYRKYFTDKGVIVESAIVEEAIVQALGEYAADVNKLFDKSPTLLGAIREFITYIKQTIMDIFNKGSVNIENIPADTTLKELAIILASDLQITNETKLTKEVVDILNQIDRCS